MSGVKDKRAPVHAFQKQTRQGRTFSKQFYKREETCCLKTQNLSCSMIRRLKIRSGSYWTSI